MRFGTPPPRSHRSRVARRFRARPRQVILIAPPVPPLPGQAYSYYPLLPLAYDASIPHDRLAMMELAGRRLGVPLDALERLGQDAILCESFVSAAQAARESLGLVGEGHAR